MLKRENKKPFSESTVGKVFNRVKEYAPDLVKDLMPGKVDDMLIDTLLQRTRDHAAASLNNAAASELAQLVAQSEVQMRADAARYAHEQRIAELAAATEEATAAMRDVQSARENNTEVMRVNGGKRDWIMASMAIYVMASNAFLVYCLAFVSIPEVNQRLFDMYAGTSIAAGLGVILSYYFGSSKSSRMKDEQLYRREALHG